MAIWLGKNGLGQTDKRQLEHFGGPTVKVNVTPYRPPDNPIRHVDAKRVDPPMPEGEVIEQQADKPAPAPAQPDPPAEPSPPKSQRQIDAL